MKWSEILPPSDLLSRTESIEQGLRQYQRLGSLGWVIGIAIVAVQLTAAITRTDYWKRVSTIDFSQGWGEIFAQLALPLNEAALAAAAFFVLAAMWVRVRLKEAQHPFHYTCSIGTFVEDQPSVTEERLKWLSRDIETLLSQRVGRLQFVEEGSVGEQGESPVPHVHIGGRYVIRKRRSGKCVVEIVPKVRIGGPDAPDTLAHTVTFALQMSTEECVAGRTGDTPVIDAKDYEQILERVYFSVATLLYERIEEDVQRKIKLLPTAYTRAVALFYEAEDYARSNTLNGYERARELYERAAEEIDRRLRPLPASRWREPSVLVSALRCQLRLAVRRYLARVWPGLASPELLCARAEIGHTNMSLYRRTLAALSGQAINPVFEARPVAERAIRRLAKMPDHVEGVRDIRFNAHVTHALALTALGDPSNANAALDRAYESEPTRAERNARFLYARSECEPRLMPRLELLKRAVDLDPRFAVARFSLAMNAEMMWRERTSLEEPVAEGVLAFYEALIKINPGNIASWANRGYVHWLMYNAEDSSREKDYLKEAQEDFESGREYKSIKQETLTSELDYGLARIFAERGDFDNAYPHYVEAVSNLLMQGRSHGADSYQGYYFELMGTAVMTRFERYKNSVTAHWKAVRFGNQGAALRRIADSVYAFALNDYGDALHNFWTHTGDDTLLSRARASYEQATKMNPRFVLPHLALIRINEKQEPTILEARLQKVEELAPNWPEGRYECLKHFMRQARNAGDERRKAEGDLADTQQELERRQAQLRAIERPTSPEALADAPQAQAAGSSRGVVKVRGEDAAERAASRRVRGRAISEGYGGDWKRVSEDLAGLSARKRELERTRDDNQRQAKIYQERAQQVLHELVPHEWLWRRGDPGESPQFNWAAVHERGSETERRWRSELNDLHVRSLFVWASVLFEWQQASENEVAHGGSPWALFERRPRTELEKFGIRRRDIVALLRLLRDHFWPSNISLLRALRREAAESSQWARYNEQIAAVVRYWLRAEPDAYWALTWVIDTAVAEDEYHRGTQRHFADPEQGEYLRRAVDSDNPHVALYAAGQLEQLVYGFWRKSQGHYSEADRVFDASAALEASLQGYRCVAAAEPASRPSGRIHPRDWYRRRFARILWALARFTESLDELNGLLRSSGRGEDTLAAAVNDICTTGSRGEDLRRLENWLYQRELELAGSDSTAYGRCRQAIFTLQRWRQTSHDEAYALGGPSIHRRLETLALLVDIDARLLSVRSDDTESFKAFLNEAIERIRERVNVEVPYPRWREQSGSFPESSYTISVGEAGIVLGRVELEQRFCPQVDAYSPMVDSVQAIADTFDPTTGALTGAWVDELTAKQLGRVGAQTWAPLDYIARHVEFVAMQHLPAFLGVDELDGLLARLGAGKDQRGVARHARRVRAEFPRMRDLLRILQGLLREQVPLTDLPTLVKAFDELWQPGCDLVQLGEVLRARARDRLPGNCVGTELVRTSAVFDARVAENIAETDGSRVFAIEAATAQELLGAVRTHLRQPATRRCAVVVGDPSVRPFVARLLALEFAGLAVLAESELLDPVRAQSMEQMTYG